MPDTIMPWIAGLFLVFAGMLIGYFLWYRDRSLEDANHQKLEIEHDQLKQSIEHLKSVAQDAESELTERNGKLYVLQKHYDDLIAGREQFQRDRIELEAELRLRQKQLEESQSRCDEEKRAKNELNDQLNSEKVKTREWQLTNENQWSNRLQQLETELAARQTDVHHLSQQCDTLRKQVGQLTEQEQLIKRQRDEARQTTEKSDAETAGRMARLENQESTICNLQQSLKDCMRELDEVKSTRLEKANSNQQVIRQLREACRSQSLQVQTLTERNHELQSEVVQAEKVQQKSASLIAQLEQNLLTKVAECGELGKQLRLIRETRTQLEKTIEEREASTSQQLAKIRSRVEQLQRDAMQHQARITTLIRERDELKSQMNEFQVIQQESEQLLELQRIEIHSRLELAVAQRDQAFDEANQAQFELEQLHEIVESQNANIEELQSQSANIVNFSSPHDTEDLIYGGSTRNDSKRGRIYSLPPVIRDDLQRLPGIDDGLERRLNEYGVYTFQQIMDWDAAVIKEFSTMLELDDLIEQHQWVEQAQQLYPQTHRRAA